ncbi:MAG TPA: nuclear transport factor 2 family protein [Pyrinomonadaceae bacterium]|nr:nuclear transport factor 2 family protein [Pyrinomonadaceae bacterium]
MRKAFPVMFSILLLTLACAPAPTNREESVTGSTNRATNSATTAALSEADAIANEKKAWQAIQDRDFDTFASMLANDQIEVTQTGVSDKAGTLASVRKLEFTEVNFSDWSFLPVDNNLVVTTYNVAVKGKMDGKDIPTDTMRGSTAWVNRDGKWQAIFHQESPVRTGAPPPATPAASPKAGASPTAQASTTTGSDPIANEKVIWTLLQNKNYDGFAALLDERALEVNTEGVFDKAGIVKGVQTFDASKAELSDFRTLNIDQDSALVTYLVTVAGQPPEKERHTTIWHNRAGKWLAVFHQGSPVEATAMSTQK